MEGLAVKIQNVFVSVNARDFTGLSQWYRTLLERDWDREPVPSCHEWTIAGCVLFQVLDNPLQAGAATASFHIVDLDKHVARLKKVGFDVPQPRRIEGFDTLRYCEFKDPEGNTVGLVEGA